MSSACDCCSISPCVEVGAARECKHRNIPVWKKKNLIRAIFSSRNPNYSTCGPSTGEFLVPAHCTAQHAKGEHRSHACACHSKGRGRVPAPRGGRAATFIVLRGCITVCMENTPNWKHQLTHVLSECRNTSEQWSFIFHTSTSQESHIGKKDNLKT